MAFLKIIKGLLGSETEELSTQTGFQFQADSQGLNFYLEKQAFEQLQTGKGNALQKIQLVTLRMLEEQGLAQTQLNSFQVLSADLVGLDSEQAEVLRLPPCFPGAFISRIEGRSGYSNFRVNLTLKLPDGSTAPLKRKGPLLQLTSTEQYRLTPAELLGLEALERHQGLSPEERNEATNLRLMAELQTAARSGMALDLSHFDRLDVVVPDSIGVVATSLPDGSLQLCPSLGEGSTPDQLEKRWGQLDMNADGGILRIDKRIVLLDEDRMAGISEVLGNRRIPADKVQEFLSTPTAFLNAALINLELGFSMRVAGIGRLQHIDFGPPESGGRDWFGRDQQPATPDILPELIQSEEDLAHFEKTCQAAWQQGASVTQFDGQNIDISNPEAVNSQTEALRTKFQSADQSAHSPEPVSEEQEEQSQSPQGMLSLLLHEAAEIRNELQIKAEQAPPHPEPDWSAYARQPYPHQQEGINWMLGLLHAALADDPSSLYRLQGGLLADDMGLGKTYMTLVALGEYLNQQETTKATPKPLLVVAPLSLLENWEDEVSKTFHSIPFRDIVVLQSERDLNDFRIKGAKRESLQLSAQLDANDQANENSIRYALHTGPEAGPQRLDMERRLVLTTYQTLRDYQFSLCRIDWGIVVFDEAQNLKNPNTLQTRAAKALKADFKLLATGTPVENSLGDFWCLMDSAQPGLLGDWPQFRDTWIRPIVTASEETRDAVRTKIGAGLREAVGRFMLRRTKEDQLQGLPQKTIHSGLCQPSTHPSLSYESTLAVPMQGAQLQAYDAILQDYRTQQGAGNVGGQALNALLQLREISLHPRLRQETQLLTSNAKQAQARMAESGKLSILLQLLEQIRSQNEKVILFMITKRLQRLIKLWLDQIYGLDIAIINGDTAAVAKKKGVRTRKKLIEEFEAQQGFNIIVMSPVAAGVGLTVVGANHVVHLERHWNPAKEAQASDRVYRIGQERDVHIHLPAVTHPKFASFDVHLDRLLHGKLMLKDAVVTPEQITESEMVRSMGL